MPLSPGTRLGAYEIAAPIGSGGMGEVYRARDARLGRDVAIKVLPAAFATDPDALARFEREMKTLAALSHPHIVAIYDVGRDGSTAYAVTELLDGETLADVVSRGPVPVRKAIEYGIQIARALAAAHDRGIVHRDLKPANIFVTGGGHVKVLDFGLARHTAVAASAERETMPGTSPGLVIGTVGYMAPEQVRGLVVDHRADIFAFGCVMYEMVSGRRAFERNSPADTLSAILKEDPPPLSSAHVGVPPAVDRVIQRCLEKNPAERFESARDLAFALEALSWGSAVGVPAVAAPPRRRRAIAALAAALAGLVTVFLLGRSLLPGNDAASVAMTRLTFDRGVIRTARFAPDGETIVYGAAWNGHPLRMFVARADTGESKPLDLPDGTVLAVSKSGEMLLSLRTRYVSGWVPSGTLARSRLLGSGVREVLEDVRDADFLSGDRLIIARRVNGRDRLEVPQGTVVFETPGYISHVRVSPDGQRVAFLEHPLFGDNRGYLALYDGSTVRRLTPEYTGVEGLTWSADGRNIWYGGALTETHWPIRVIDPDTRTPRHGRTVWHVPRDLLLMDIDARGRLLLTGNDAGGLTAGAVAGETPDRDLSSGRFTLPGHVSRDGRTMLFSNMDETDPNYHVVMRRADGSAPVRIGRGRAQALSPDGKWAVSITPSEPRQVLLFPTGPGEPRTIDVGDLDANVAVFIPSGLTLGVVGARNGSPSVVVVDVSSGRRSTIELPELRDKVFNERRFLPTHASPDGALLAIQADGGQVLAWPLPDGGKARELSALGANEVFAGWSADPARIFVAVWNGPRARIDALDITSGRRTFIREITVSDPAGMMAVPDLFLSADANSYIYGFPRMLSTLYLVSGLE